MTDRPQCVHKENMGSEFGAGRALEVPWRLAGPVSRGDPASGESLGRTVLYGRETGMGWQGEPGSCAGTRPCDRTALVTAEFLPSLPRWGAR